MTRAIRIHETGGPEVMRLEDVEVVPPVDGEVQLRHTAIGINFIDVYDRTGLYPQPLPGGLGREGAGVITALGRKVRGFEVGQHVAYVTSKPGSYCEVRNVPASRVVRIPAGVTDEQAAVLMLKGMTACYLLRHTHRVKRGDAIVVHAAAGGVGSLLSQWGRALGATVIGVVGSPGKEKLAKQNGCKHVLVRGRDEFVSTVRKLTKGQGVHVVYDAVGRDTFFESLDCLRKRGLMVCYGSSSGPVEPFAPTELVKRGSLFLTRPTLFDYTADRADLERMARETFAAVKKKWVKIRINQRYPLAEAQRAHRELEGRKTTGASVLIP